MARFKNKKPDAKNARLAEDAQIYRRSNLQSDRKVVRPMVPSQRRGKIVLQRNSNGLDNEHYISLAEKDKPQ
jgi:hypothetical protein